METSELIIGGIGLLSNIVTGFVSWFFTRRKYNSEVDNNVIRNMKDSLEFYTSISDDNKDRLEELLKRNKELEVELQELRKQVLNLTMNICMDLTCAKRVYDYQITDKKNGKKVSRYNETHLVDDNK